MENNYPKLLLRICRSSPTSKMEGYRLAIESSGLPAILIADVKIHGVDEDFVLSRGVHNRVAREIICSERGYDQITCQAYAHILKTAQDYSAGLGMKLEEVKD